jgi:cellulose synthase/poly-beta-1,6-N-acetylglucosamine synthase-like glycosyltransferase
MITVAGYNHLALLMSFGWLCIIGASYSWILLLFLTHRRAGLAEEHRLLGRELPADSELPHVLIQVPVRNEGELVCRIATAIAELDWPTDRLHVQILDDSDDGSLFSSEEALGALRRRNVDATVLHRRNRNGFKAGALAAGLELSDHEFVAVFDADYVPPKDFLKSCMRPLLANPTIAFVQARADFLNAKESLVTRIQQRLLDAHYVIEQAARSWSGHIMPFNGTCGVWRRAAIDEAGGWQGDTLAEDLDLSYRAQLLGWRPFFLTTVVVSGELPASLRTWLPQQFRWRKGSAEVARKILPLLVSSHLGFSRKLMSGLHLCGALLGPMAGVILVSGAIDLTLGMGMTFSTALLAVIFALELMAAQSLVLLSQYLVRRANVFTELIKLQLILFALGYVHFANSRANLEAWLGYETDFVRTPKTRRSIGVMLPEPRPAPILTPIHE